MSGSKGTKRKAESADPEDDGLGDFVLKPAKLSYAQKKAKKLAAEIVKQSQSTVAAALPYGDEDLEKEVIADGKKEYEKVTEAFAVNFASRLYNAKVDKVAEARIAESTKKRENTVAAIMAAFERELTEYDKLTGDEIAASKGDFKEALEEILD